MKIMKWKTVIPVLYENSNRNRPKFVNGNATASRSILAGTMFPFCLSALSISDISNWSPEFLLTTRQLNIFKFTNSHFHIFTVCLTTFVMQCSSYVKRGRAGLIKTFLVLALNVNLLGNALWKSIKTFYSRVSS